MRRRAWQILGTLGLAVLMALTLVPGFARPAWAEGDEVVIKFYNNDGTDNYQSVSASADSKITYPKAPGRNGYQFNTWTGSKTNDWDFKAFDGQPGALSKYTAGTIATNTKKWSENEDNQQYGVAENSLYASWDINKYHLNIDLGAYNAAIDDTSHWLKQSNASTKYSYTSDGHTYNNYYTVESNDITLPTPTRAKYIFSGWKLEGDDKVVKDVTIKKGSTGERTYVAQWENVPTEVAITFNPNGGEGEAFTQTFPIETGTLPACTYTREGYTFAGWGNDSDYDKATRYPGSDGTNQGYKVSQLPGEVSTLYAQWVPNTINITLDPNGGNGDVQTVSLANSDGRFPQSDGFVKTGYEFSGWSRTKSGGTIYNAGSPINGTFNADATLYAQWKPITYSIKLNNISYTELDGSNTNDWATISGTNQVPTNNQVKYDAAIMLPSVKNRSNATFAYWTTNADGTGTQYENGASIVNLTNKNETVINLYAQWIPSQYTVSFDANGGSGTMDSQTVDKDNIVLPECGFTREGYTFTYWKLSKPVSDNRYTPGTKASDINVTDGKITFSAQWSPIHYFVAFDANGGSGEMPNGARQERTYDQKEKLTKNAFMRDGYTFTGWNTAADGSGVTYADEATDNVTSDPRNLVTLYAQWTKNPEPNPEPKPEPEPEPEPTPTPEPTPAPEPAKVETTSVFRLYNPNSGEHFYTVKADEKNDLVAAGWNDEGIGWTAPVTSGTPVYRLYSGTDHHFTTSASEREHLVSVGWKDEGIGFYSDDAHGVPLYRQFNPNVDPGAAHNNSGSHNYTTSKAENDHLVSLGWHGEGVCWYGVKQ